DSRALQGAGRRRQGFYSCCKEESCLSYSLPLSSPENSVYTRPRYAVGSWLARRFFGCPAPCASTWTPFAGGFLRSLRARSESRPRNDARRVGGTRSRRLRFRPWGTDWKQASGSRSEGAREGAEAIAA